MFKRDSEALSSPFEKVWKQNYNITSNRYNKSTMSLDAEKSFSTMWDSNLLP